MFFSLLLSHSTKSWGNSYIKFIILDIKFCFTCDGLDLYQQSKIPKYFEQDFLKTFPLFSTPPMKIQVPGKVLIGFKEFSSIEKLPITKVEGFLKSYFKLNQDSLLREVYRSREKTHIFYRSRS